MLFRRGGKPPALTIHHLRSSASLPFTENRHRGHSQPAYRAPVREPSHGCCGSPVRCRRAPVQCTGRRAKAPARDARLTDRLRCPRRWTKQQERRQASPGAAQRGRLVDPLCLRWPGSACHVVASSHQGEVCPLKPSPPATIRLATGD